MEVRKVELAILHPSSHLSVNFIGEVQNVALAILHPWAHLSADFAGGSASGLEGMLADRPRPTPSWKLVAEVPSDNQPVSPPKQLDQPVTH